MKKRRWGGLRLIALALLLALPGTAFPLTPAGTVIRHDFSARFATPGVREVRSNETQVSVKDLSDPELVPPRTATTSATVPVDFRHTLTNRGNFPDSFRLKAAAVDAALPENGQAPQLRFYAADGVTPFPTDAGGLQVIGPLDPGVSVELVLRATPAAGSEGRVTLIAVSATSVLVPARSASLTNQLQVPAGGVSFLKAVSPVGGVLPGTILTYSITLGNSGGAPVAGVRVVDPLDSLLEYQPGSATLPAGVPGSVSFDAATRTLVFDIPSLPAGFSGEITFRARVRDDAPGNASIVNTAGVSTAENAAPILSNSTLNTVLVRLLQVTKAAGSSAAEAGDIVSYTVRVQNIGDGVLNHVTVADRIPRGFRYLKGSSHVGGFVVADPVGGGQQLSWDLGSLEPGAFKVLNYRLVVSAEAPVGNAVNWARATGAPAGGGSVVSPPASATVKVRSSVLGSKAVIMGRVFHDGNGNGVPDQGERGEAGVRVYLEDGSFVFTDVEGQYSFTGVSAGDHVVKLDRSTLDPGLVSVPYNTAFAGVGWSQFITVPFGGPARGDFALAANPHAPAAAGQTGQTSPTSPTSPTRPTLSAPPSAEPGSADAVPRLRLTPDRVELPADAKTTVPFKVELLDPAGRRVPGSATVTLFLAMGTLLEPDLDPALPGHQIRVTDGLGVFQLRSGRATGNDLLIAKDGNGSAAQADLFFSPDRRDWILVGLGSLTVGGKAVSGNLEKIDRDDRFDEGIFHEERLAFFTRGKILGKYLLTAAYDSDKERRDGVFQAIDPEKYYPVYGDATDIGYEAESRGKIYLKLESGRSYLMAGDYRTDLSENEFSRYDRALNGAKFEVNTKSVTVKGFESRTEETVTRDDIPGNGTSGHYFLSRRDVFENSERVRIEVRDRYHTERVIAVTEKVRYADYSIDYQAGTILFKEPVPSLDQFLNPVTIVINYQATGPGEERYVYGGRVEIRSENGSHLGGTAVVEQQARQDNTLFGLDGAWRLGERLTLKGEGAVSEDLEHGRGSAWKTELAARPIYPLLLNLYYRKVESDFFNTSMTGTELGTEKYGGRADYRVGADALVFAESFLHRYELGGRKLFANHAGAVKKFSLLQLEGGVKVVREESGGKSEESDLVYAGVIAPITKKLNATLRREQLLSASGVDDYQTKTFAKLDYRLTERTKAFLTEEYQEGSPLIRQATLFGLESRLSDRMRLTTGYQMSSGASGYSQQSNVDLNTRLMEREGFSLDSRTGYQIEHALSQQRGQAIVGLNSRYRAAEGLYLNSSLERVQTVQGNTGTRTAFTLGGEYLSARDLKLSGRYEVRTGPGETASLYGANAAYKMSPSLTLLGKLSLWDRDADAGDDVIFDGYLGSAFRPLAGQPLQLLTLARYKVEDRRSLPGSFESRSVILSAEPTYRIVSRWSAQGKYAGKLSWADGVGGMMQSYTDLVLAGLSYDLAERWEIAAYLKLMNQYDARMHSLGAVGSAGYRVYRNVVLSAGYNFARLDDRDLTGETFQGQGPFVGIKVKFDEDMFESQQARVIPIPVPPPVALVPPAAAPVPALLVRAERLDEPLLLSGSAELFTLLVNGERAKLPSTEVTLTRERLGSLELKGGRFPAPLVFLVSVEQPEQVGSWTLKVMNREGEALRTLQGTGAPAKRIPWLGDTDRRKVEQGEIYQYQLQVTYLDGSVFSTGRELFGVNRREAVLLTLSGGAFVFDRSELTLEAKRLLKGAARVLRARPQEKVIVEGHTDGIGSVEYNLALSQRRCDAAAEYLVREEGIARSRLLRRWYGKSRPVADNVTSPGRRMNRRVELKGDFKELHPVSPDDRYRTKPFVVINGRSIRVDDLGRFDTTFPGHTLDLDLEMGDSQGRFLATSLPLPDLAMTEPPAETLVGYGTEASGVRVDADGKAHCMLSGTVEGTSMEVAGRKVPLDEAGRFTLDLPLAEGDQLLGVVLRNGSGCTKLMNLRLRSERRTLPPARGER